MKLIINKIKFIVAIANEIQQNTHSALFIFTPSSVKSVHTSSTIQLAFIILFLSFFVSYIMFDMLSNSILINEIMAIHIANMQSTFFTLDSEPFFSNLAIIRKNTILNVFKIKLTKYSKLAHPTTIT